MRGPLLALALAVSCGFGLAFTVRPAAAQPLQRLHVRDFTTTTDPKAVRVGEAFRLIITIRVDENVASIDNVHLPDTSDFTAQGDERHLTSTGTGTLYTETLTLTASTPGVKTIPPATFEAVNALDGKPSLFKTDPTTIRILPASVGASIDPFWSDAVRAELQRLVGLAGWLIALGILLVVIARKLWPQREAPERHAAEQATIDANPPRTRADDLLVLRDLTTDLERDPSRRRVLEVRRFLLGCAGGREHETLVDLERRVGRAAAPAFVAALRAVERASFCEEHRLHAAIATAVHALHDLAQTPDSLEIRP